MHNLRELKGSYKGTIGECMFKLTRKLVVLPKFWNKNKYFSIFGKYLTDIQKEFIALNWYSIDAVEIIYKKGQKEATIYEIKTKNQYKKELGFKPKMTLSTHRLYEEAKQKGFIVKLAVVKFYDNWDYSIELVDFDIKNYCIDKPKRYDKDYKSSSFII